MSLAQYPDYAYFRAYRMTSIALREQLNYISTRLQTSLGFSHGVPPILAADLSIAPPRISDHDLTPNRGSRKIPLPRPDLATNKHFTLLGASRRHNQTSHELAYYDVWNSLPGIFTPSLHSTGAWRFVPAQADEPLAAFSGQFISCQHTVRIVDRRRVSPGEI
ncbi:hypothetical protein D9611_013010 [Ephemerocybe angulata]|uniref:Uncharacterized protein n=1 Tax=Ephemerocybe angulata TaxID=980116 RepID=A0A8H5ETB0_9AGAR|nr:hypothetical protein D9611_013010 [Tulosesus angulatus]